MEVPLTNFILIQKFLQEDKLCLVVRDQLIVFLYFTEQENICMYLYTCSSLGL